MTGRHAAVMKRLHDAVFAGPGTLARETRHGVAKGHSVPRDAAAYVAKVEQHAYRVTDADIAALRTAGYSDDAIFELTVCTALGAGLLRREAGLAAIAGAR